MLEIRHKVIQASVGSTNYNLVDENSDIDYKIFVIPTFDDLYTNNYYHDSFTSKATDYTTHDIRKLPQLLWKANINFIEILFAKELNYHSAMDKLFEWKQDLATMNLPYLFKACIGMYEEKMKNIYKGTSNTKHLVEKYGYDTKDAMCAYRVLDFLIRMAENNFDFGKSIWYDDSDASHNLLMDIKRGRITENTFMKIKDDRLNYAMSLKDLFYKQKPNDILLWDLNKLIKDIVKNDL